MTLFAINDFSHNLGLLRITSIPNFTRILLSPVRGTISAIVPSATISSSLFRFIFTFSKPLLCIILLNAHRKKNVTPQAANSFSGKRESFLLGLISAYAFGNFWGSSWWSITTTSKPRLLAKSISSTSDEPQSTQISNFMPFALIFLTASILSP
ncbi:MAG: hypothetical protein ILNGONEN_02215 [Syntrophorhabdaceae bacterium]|nr:hypothetical protein [Syntrophorhabdaceae bacterium]